jgi:acetyl-CoA carboxylase biotin carboxyl carrier protein
VPDFPAADIEAIIDLFDRSDWKEIHLTTKEFEIFLSKEPGSRRTSFQATPAGATTAPKPAKTPALVTIAEKPAARAQDFPEGWFVVKAPSLGTFYRAPKPGAAPFVSVGQKVEVDAELCLVEVMKLFTTMRAQISGTVREILVKDGELVECGQPLFLLEPDV